MSIIIKSNIMLNSVKILTTNRLKRAKINFTFLSTNSNQSQTNNQDSQKQKAESKMNHFKNNPYFSKYEAKLKSLYK
jgi:hypothetical protein